MRVLPCAVISLCSPVPAALHSTQPGLGEALVPIDPDDLRTGGGLQGAVAASLLRARDSAAELAPGAAVGIYRIVRELGRGGMAIVYLADRADGEYQQRVALKWMLQAQPDAESQALFRRERQALADLRHPHIARLLDGGAMQGRPWFAMELIEGERLDRHCVAAGLAQRQRLALFQQVCAAVAFAHARGILHRDIKPSNVLVDADGSAKLLDFGIAQLLGDDDALAARACTPGFASPEQLHGERLTVASDVFQLGRLLAALLSADEQELEAMTTVAVDAGTPMASTLPASLPRDLQAILQRATASSPGERYATADAFAADISAYLERRPVAARRRTAGYVAGQFLRRHPIGVAAGTAILLATIALTTVFTMRLKTERDIAERERAASEAINRFLNEDVLDAANPLRRAPGAPEVTVREALDAAQARVEQRFGASPSVALSVLTTLGVLRFEFGEDDRAMALYDRALDYAAQLPADDPGRLRLRAERSALLITQQDFDAAVAELEPLASDATRAFGANDTRTLEWQLRLLEARSKQGLDIAFVGDLRALAQRADAALGTPNAIAAEAALFAAHSLVFAGKPDQGLADAEYAHAALAAVHGPDYPSTLKALVAVAHGRRAQGHDDDAIAAMRQAYELQIARYDRNSGDAMYMQNELAFTLSAVGRVDEAEPLFADLVQRRFADIDSVPANYLQALGNLANTRLKQGRANDALADFDRAVGLLQDAPKIPPSIQSNLHRGRADALRELGRFDEAAAALDASAVAAEALPEKDARRFALQGSRGRLLIARGKRAEGLAMLDTAIASLQANVPASHPVLKTFVDVRTELAAQAP